MTRRLPVQHEANCVRWAARLFIAGALVLLLAGLSAFAESRTDSGRPTCDARASADVPSARLALLARGFNLTGWLDGPTVRRPDPGVLANLRSRGFTHIRLPVTAERLMEAFSSPDEVARRLAELDRALGTLVGLGYGVSLDLHPGNKLGRLHVAEPNAALDLIDALWRRLARRYADYPDDRLFLELLNEPSVEAKVWNAQAARLIRTIRGESPRRTLIFGPANFQRIEALLELVPFPDPNIVYAAHFYDPMIFTHQGLDWSDDPLRYLHGVPFPAKRTDSRIVQLLSAVKNADAARLVEKDLVSPWTEERIERGIARAAAWSERHRRAVIINEFGVLGWKAAPADRIRWLTAVRTAAERHCIGWTHWDYADGFGFVRRLNDREIPDEAVVEALLGRSSSR
jgi:endoglucanase